MKRLAGAVLVPLAMFGRLADGADDSGTDGRDQPGIQPGAAFAEVRAAESGNKLKDLPGNNAVNFLQAVIMIPLMFWLTWTMVRDRLTDILRLPMLPASAGAAGGRRC